MVIYVVLASLIIVQKKLLVIIVPNLVILVWDVPSVGKIVLPQIQPNASNVARKATSQRAAQRMLSLIGSKASGRHIVGIRTKGKMISALDLLLMMLVKQVKEKPPCLRREGMHLAVNPELGVDGLLMIQMI